MISELTIQDLRCSEHVDRRCMLKIFDLNYNNCENILILFNSDEGILWDLDMQSKIPCMIDERLQDFYQINQIAIKLYEKYKFTEHVYKIRSLSIVGKDITIKYGSNIYKISPNNTMPCQVIDLCEIDGKKQQDEVNIFEISISVDEEVIFFSIFEF